MSPITRYENCSKSFLLKSWDLYAKQQHASLSLLTAQGAVDQLVREWPKSENSLAEILLPPLFAQVQPRIDITVWL